MHLSARCNEAAIVLCRYNATLKAEFGASSFTAIYGTNTAGRSAIEPFITALTLVSGLGMFTFSCCRGMCNTKSGCP